MSTATKFIQNPTEVVNDAINGYCAVHHARVVRLTGTGVVALRAIRPDRVALVCGGGSGHEPAHIGFVRDSCLTAAVCGNVFASPPITDVAAAIRYIDQEQRRQSVTPAGILVVVKNYTGDVLNFGYAVREAAARGVQVEMIVVGDDVTFGSDHTTRRGVAGTVVLYQLLGAAAARGNKTIGELVQLSESISNSLVTFGASMSSCTIPGSKKNTEVGEGMVELGLGIHGERGLEAVPFVSLHDVVTSALDKLLEKAGGVCPNTGAADHAVLLLLNNLGATTDLEMSVTLTHTLQQLKQRGLTVERVAVGRYMTALDMHGVSWTLMRLPNHSDVLAYKTLLALSEWQPDFSLGGDWIPFSTPQLELAQCQVEVGARTSDEMIAALMATQQGPAAQGRQPVIAKRLLHIVRTLEPLCDYFNDLDAKVGDGDTGFGVARACRGVIAVADRLPWATDLPGSIRLVAHVIADAFAGSSGPLYGGFLVAVGEGLPASFDDVKDEASLCQLLRGCFIRGTEAVKSMGHAAKGDRTMVDVLEGVIASEDVHAATSLPQLLAAASSAARAAADGVKGLRAQKGRSRYLGGKEVGEADPGCELVCQWLSLAAESLSVAP